MVSSEFRDSSSRTFTDLLRCLRGAKAREESKKAKKQAAIEAASKPSAWAVDDDEDGMGFFANTTSKPALEEDEDMGSVGGTETPKKKPAAPRKRKVDLDEHGQPKPKRKRRTKAEMEAARARGEK
jgi:hypothetical protein